jgi:hypothetical protein
VLVAAFLLGLAAPAAGAPPGGPREGHRAALQATALPALHAEPDPIKGGRIIDGDPHKASDFRWGRGAYVWGLYDVDCAANQELGLREDLVRALVDPARLQSDSEVSALPQCHQVHANFRDTFFQDGVVGPFDAEVEFILPFDAVGQSDEVFRWTPHQVQGVSIQRAASQFEGKSRLFSSAGRAPSDQRESVATLQRLQESHRAWRDVLDLQCLHMQSQADRARVLLGQLLGGSSPQRKPSRGLGGGADGPAQLGRTYEPCEARTARARAETHRTNRALRGRGARHVRRGPDRSESPQGIHSSAIGIQHLGPRALTFIGHCSPSLRRGDQERLA